MGKTKLLIVADDLTGGLDTGVQFAKRGISVRVIFDMPAGNEWSEADAQVLVAVSETRHLPPEAAYKTVYGIVSAAKRAGIPYVYKKTDSALRGNIGAELSAALDASGEDVISFLPAYPAMSRVTVGGRHYIDGVPVAQSAFGSDPFNPVTESDVAKLIKAQTDTPVLRGNEAGGGILLVDAETDADLRAAGTILEAKGRLSVSAGCAGFAALLPELLGLESEGTPRPSGYGDGLLVISGSLNPVTLRQLDAAEADGFERIRLDPQEKLEPDRACVPKIHGKWTIVDSSDGEQNRAAVAEYIIRNGWTNEQVRVRVAASLAEMLSKLIPACGRTIMIIGGDTLLACLKRLNCSGIEPLAEPFPGVVLSRYRIGDGGGLLISKSGGFGKETLLTELRDMMEGRTKDRSKERR